MMKNVIKSVAVGLILLGIAGGTQAATISIDDFEDGNHDGWTINGDAGSTGVEDHNLSQMAYVKVGGKHTYSLSQNLLYNDDYTLSFDIQAAPLSATDGARTRHAGSGLIISFLGAFGSPLGSMTLYNATDANDLDEDDIPITDTQYHFGYLMSYYASTAGLDTTDGIEMINLNFFVWADEYHPAYSGGWFDSSASIWFDNVSISDSNAVPIPGAFLLLGFGLTSLTALRRDRN